MFYFLCLAIGALLMLGLTPRTDLNRALKQGRFPASKYNGLSEDKALLMMKDDLAELESTYTELPDGAEKTIAFACKSQPKKTQYCVLYIHGFSACRQEISPIPDDIAAELSANYHATRLTGHGLDGDTLAEATPYDWMFDTLEAWQIAAQLGEQVIVICTSTGGTLTTWLAQQDVTVGKLAALVMVAPNFGPKHKAMPLFQLPWSRYWIPLISSGVRRWEPENEASEKYWTYEYPTSIIHDMSALVRSVCRSPVESIEVPTLFIYCEEDEVVNAKKTDRIIRRWGANVTHRILFPPRPSGNNHVITGDIVNPDATESTRSDISLFLHLHVIKK